MGIYAEKDAQAERDARPQPWVDDNPGEIEVPTMSRAAALEMKLQAAEIALKLAGERIAFLEHSNNEALEALGRANTKVVHLKAELTNRVKMDFEP